MNSKPNSQILLFQPTKSCHIQVGPKTTRRAEVYTNNNSECCGKTTLPGVPTPMVSPRDISYAPNSFSFTAICKQQSAAYVEIKHSIVPIVQLMGQHNIALKSTHIHLNHGSHCVSKASNCGIVPNGPA